MQLKVNVQLHFHVKDTPTVTPKNKDIKRIHVRLGDVLVSIAH